ncbi:MAG TPA: phosphodiester glycosidase family protein [Terriglobales bacterium]|nr:phosphodiester glycosidase family protein [Terriglobales bacterium]
MSFICRSTIRRAILTAAFCCLLPATLWSECPSERIARNVVCVFTRYTDPVEEVHLMVIDLSKKRAIVRTVPAGPDPDGDGKWQTVLMPTSKIAEREGFDIAVNGDFFAIPRGKDAEGEAALTLFANGVPALVTGPAMTDGKTWSSSEKPRQAVVVTRNGRIQMLDAATAPPDAVQVISGRDFLVVKGKAQFTDSGVTYKPGEFRNVNPRTAVGINKKGDKLYLLVVDGRSDRSRGMTYGQLAQEMVKAGAYTAINLDGGGSSTMVVRDSSTKMWKVLNQPSDKKERAVANVLGITLSEKVKR